MRKAKLTQGVARTLFNLHLQINYHTRCPGLCRVPSKNPAIQSITSRGKEAGGLTQNLGQPNLHEPFHFLAHLSRSFLAIYFCRDHEKHVVWTTTQIWL